MGTAVSEAQMLCVGKGPTLPVSYGGKRIVPPELLSGIVPRPGADKYVGDKLITPHHPVPPPNLGSLNNPSTIPGSLPCQRKKCIFCPSSSSYTYQRQSQEDCSLLTLLRKMLEFYWRGKKQSTAYHIREELQGEELGRNRDRTQKPTVIYINLQRMIFKNRIRIGETHR